MATISIITTVSRPHHLLLAYAELSAQTSHDWEWILVPHAEAKIPDPLNSDPRVHVLATPEWVASLGAPACQKFGAEKSSGRFLLLLDQLDTLVSGAIARYLTAIGSDDVDICYGDFVPAPGDTSYPAAMGWELYDAVIGGKRLTVVSAFEPDASSLHHSIFAPVHGLLWRRETYFAADGPRVDLGTEADFDLLCRAYLAGARIAHLDDCLVTSQRTVFASANAERAQQLSNNYVYDLIAESSRRRSLPMFDMGAAHNPAPGFVSVDLHDAEVNCDIRYGLPVADNSVGAIRAHDFLEHMTRCPDSTCTHGDDGKSPRCAVGVMNEFYRALAPGGWLITRTPSSDGRGAFQDPTHVSFWNPNSFWYYTRRDQARFVPGIKCRFQGTRIWQMFPSEWHQTHNIPYACADLIALKGQRQPGLCEI